ncbi:MAG: hypothetical protein FWC27_11625 [Firmicutes bacterium]|nr:hypothetical protein [Bacillota bacterium]
MKMKQVLAFLLCAALLAAVLALPAGAAQACGCGEVLQVFVDGFGGNALFYDEGTPEQREVGLAVTDNLAGDIFKALGWLALTPVSRGGKSIANAFGAVLGGMMGHLAMDERGRSVEPITAHWKIDKKKDHTKNPEYKYEYDWRGDPFEAAAGLNDFIKALCAHTGHKKIALTGFSEGSAVAMTYLKQYGSSRLEALLLVNGAWQGLQMVGELLTGQVELSGPAVTNYIANYDDGSGSLRRGMDLVRRLHLLDFTAPLGRGLVAAGGDALYFDVLNPLFGQMPVIWTFTPADYYRDARAMMLGDETKYKALLEKTDRYQYEVQARAHQLLEKARKDGVKIAVVCGYGSAPIPATKSKYYQTDSLIDTARASGGATVAPFGETLPPSNSKYRSPDGIIDAATCMYPDYTWFMKDTLHKAAPTKELRMWLIHSKKQPTVWANPAFPQYLDARQ